MGNSGPAGCGNLALEHALKNKAINIISCFTYLPPGFILFERALL